MNVAGWTKVYTPQTEDTTKITIGIAHQRVTSHFVDDVNTERRNKTTPL